jgi:hypothetical protein
VDGHGEVRAATVKVETSSFDEENWATATVSIVGTDGAMLAQGSYRVDGRA